MADDETWGNLGGFTPARPLAQAAPNVSAGGVGSALGGIGALMGRGTPGTMSGGVAGGLGASPLAGRAVGAATGAARPMGGLAGMGAALGGIAGGLGTKPLAQPGDLAQGAGGLAAPGTGTLQTAVPGLSRGVAAGLQQPAVQQKPMQKATTMNRFFGMRGRRGMRK